MKNTAAKKYIRQVKRLYRGKRRFKRQFIQELKDALLCYLEEHPEATYTDLTKEFGHPSEIRDQLSFHTADELHLRNMTLYWTVVGLCSVAVITVVFFTVRHVVFMHDYSKGYYIEQWEDDENGCTRLCIHKFSAQEGTYCKKSSQGSDGGICTDRHGSWSTASI